MHRRGIFLCLVLAPLLGTSSRAVAFDTPGTFVRPPAIRTLAFSPDGRMLVGAFGGEGQLTGAAAWDVKTGKSLWCVPSAAAGPVSFNTDGTVLAVARGTPNAILLDPNNGKVLRELGPHPKTVRSVAFIPGSGLLATASDDVIRLWNTKTGKVERELAGGHTAEVRSLVISPGGKWLVSTGADATRIWNAATGAELKNVIKQSRGIAYYGITFLIADRLMMSNNSGSQAVRELPSGKVLLRFTSEGGYDQSSYSEAAGLGAFASFERVTVAVADLTFRSPTAEEKTNISKLLQQLDDDSYETREAATASIRVLGSVAEPALQVAASTSPSAEVRMRARVVRQAILDKPIRWLNGHTGPVKAMAFAPNGQVFATGAEDGTIRLWDPRTGKQLRLLVVGNLIAGGKS